jgi:hypothetical protein
MIAALLSAGIFSTLLRKSEKFIQPAYTSAPVEEIFGKDGLPIDHSLDINPLQVSAEHIVFSDRVLQLFAMDPTNLLSGASKISEAMQNVPVGIDKYLLVAPTRIAFEDEAYRLFSGDMAAAISETYSSVPSDVKSVDVSVKLAAHNSEYLYFRTEPSWTSLGAYYAAEAYCETAGMTPPDLSKYREYRFAGYVGAFREITQTESLINFPDYVAFYLSDGMKNKQTITARLSSDEFITYDSPSVSQSRMGTDIFIGSYFSQTIIEGDVQNKKVMMIVGDEYAKAYAAWMIPCCEKIVLIDPRYFAGSDVEFMRMFDDYKITDFIILENAQNLGESILNNRIHQIFTGSTPE